MKKPLVYIAGPYSGGNVSRNVQHALHMGDLVYDIGGVPMVPHLCHLWDLVDPHPYEHWLKLDLDTLEHCNALFRLEGESPGAEREIDFALEHGIPVFRHFDELEDWLLLWEVNQE